MIKKKTNKKYTLFGYIIILLCLIVFFIILSINSYQNYQTFKNHKNYFNNTPIKIGSWMAPHTVLKHFNITQQSLFLLLNATNSSSNLISPISTICSNKKENCTLILEKLNNAVK